MGDFVWDARLMDSRSPVSRNAWQDFSVLGAGTRG
jgi:hypothetical protein